MATLAIVKTGGKQYIVKENDTINVDRIEAKKDEKVKLETLAYFGDDGKTVELGTPVLAKSVTGTVTEHSKADKIRVARFKSKVRYRKVRGYRHSLTTLKIASITA